MKKKKVFRSMLLAGMLSLIVASTAFAALAIDGGTWDYGYKNYYMTVYSNYYHPTLLHGSSVKGAWFDSDYNVPRGLISSASADAAFSGNHCYYTVGARK